jgi:hypothetical protein
LEALGKQEGSSINESAKGRIWIAFSTKLGISFRYGNIGTGAVLIGCDF